MPDLSILWSPAPYHLISYGTLLGSSIFQSFVNGIVAYRSLPRPQFSTLQQAIFPIYFSIQSALPVVMALTYPGTQSMSRAIPSGLGGLLARENRFTTLVPIATIFAINVSNLLVIGPATTRIMKERKQQETRDGKKSYDSPPHSKEMTRLNKSFGKMHGVSASLNLVSLFLMIGYGVVLSGRIQ